MPPGLWGPHWWRQWCWPSIITIRKARASGNQNYCSYLAGREGKESEVDSYWCSGEKINSSVFKGSTLLKAFLCILVDKHAGHQSRTHACKMHSTGRFVFISNRISYCSYVHHFIQDAVSGSMLKWPYQTTWIFTLERAESVGTQSSVWKFMLTSSEQHLSYISNSFLQLLTGPLSFFALPLQSSKCAGMFKKFSKLASFVPMTKCRFEE